VYLLHYGHQNLTKTKFVPFDDYFYGLTWACGVDNTAVKFTWLERAVQIDCNKNCSRDSCIVLIVSSWCQPAYSCDTIKYIN